MYLPLLNLAAIEKLPETYSAAICGKDIGDVRFCRGVVLMFRVPLYAISSWWGLKNFTVADIIDPIRDVYEVWFLFSKADVRDL